jgi:hypothetical protein
MIMACHENESKSPCENFDTKTEHIRYVLYDIGMQNISNCAYFFQFIPRNDFVTNEAWHIKSSNHKTSSLLVSTVVVEEQ